MMEFYKKGRMELDTLIVLIIVILIILLIAFLIFNNNILSWFGNLPGYDENKDKLVDKLDKDLEIKLNYYKVALVQKGSNINFCTKGDCSILRDSKLYVKGNEEEGIIYISQKGFVDWDFFNPVDFFNPDDKVGVFRNGKVILDPGFDKGSKEKEGLPLKEDMINLHESIYISGILYKDKKVSLIETGKLDENKNIIILLENSFKTPIHLKYEGKWKWSEFFNNGEWLAVNSDSHINAKELKQKDIEAYNFILSLTNLNNEGGIKLILQEILKKKGKNATNLAVMVDGIDNIYHFDSNSPELGNYAIFIRSIGAEKYEN